MKEGKKPTVAGDYEFVGLWFFKDIPREKYVCS
jgi:hypothetical protein